MDSMDSLDRFGIDEDAYKADLEILDRYQQYSAELLRLSLLIFTGLGLLIASFVSGDLGLPDRVKNMMVDSFFRWLAGLAVAGLAVSALFALLHRYYSTDGFACHLRSVRLTRKMASFSAPGFEDQLKEVSAEKVEEVARRKGRYKLSDRLLHTSVISLGASAILTFFLLGILLIP